MTAHSKQEHKQAPIYADGEVIFSVDEKLQTLIQYLNDNDIYTYNSCEGNVNDTCWIEYYLGSWLEITEMAFRTQSQELYRFIEDACKVLLLSTDDGMLDENDEYWIEGENLIWSASVRFSKELLPDFEALVKSTLIDKQKVAQ